MFACVHNLSHFSYLFSVLVRFSSTFTEKPLEKKCKTVWAICDLGGIDAQTLFIVYISGSMPMSG